MPSATFLGFVATFLSLSVSYALTGIRPLLIEMTEFAFDYTLLLMIFGMAIRHQIRVVFMDDFYVDHCSKTESWRAEFWLVLIVSALGGIILTIYFYGREWISAFMLFYCILFTIFGLLVFKKMVSSIECSSGILLKKWEAFPKDLWPVTISLVVDIFLLLLWGFWCATILSQDRNGPDDISTAFALIVTAILCVTEYLIVFQNPLGKRLSDAKKMLL